MLLNSLRLVNELGLKTMIFSSRKPENIIFFGNNLCPTANDQQDYYCMTIPLGVYDQHQILNFDHNNISKCLEDA